MGPYNRQYVVSAGVQPTMANEEAQVSLFRSSVILMPR